MLRLIYIPKDGKCETDLARISPFLRKESTPERAYTELLHVKDKLFGLRECQMVDKFDAREYHFDMYQFRYVMYDRKWFPLDIPVQPHVLQTKSVLATGKRPGGNPFGSVLLQRPTEVAFHFNLEYASPLVGKVATFLNGDYETYVRIFATHLETLVKGSDLRDKVCIFYDNDDFGKSTQDSSEDDYTFFFGIKYDNRLLCVTDQFVPRILSLNGKGHVIENSLVMRREHLDDEGFDNLWTTAFNDIYKATGQTYEEDCITPLGKFLGLKRNLTEKEMETMDKVLRDYFTLCAEPYGLHSPAINLLNIHCDMVRAYNVQTMIFMMEEEKLVTNEEELNEGEQAVKFQVVGKIPENVRLVFQKFKSNQLVEWIAFNQDPIKLLKFKNGF